MNNTNYKFEKYINKFKRQFLSLENELEGWRKITITPEVQQEIDVLLRKIEFWRRSFFANDIDIG